MSAPGDERQRHDPFAALRQPNFIAYAWSRLCAATAMTLLTAVIAWQVYQISGSALQLGLLGLARFVPSLGLSLVGGAFADSYNRKRIIMTAQAVPLAASATLFVSTMNGWVTVPLIYGIVLLVAVPGRVREPGPAIDPPDGGATGDVSKRDCGEFDGAVVRVRERAGAGRDDDRAGGDGWGICGAHGADGGVARRAGAAATARGRWRAAGGESRGDQGGGAVRLPAAGIAGGDDTRHVRGDFRRGDGAAADLRDRHPRCGAARVRGAFGVAGGGGAAGGAFDGVPAAHTEGGSGAADLRGPVRAGDDSVRAVAIVPALGGDLHVHRDGGPGERGDAADDDPAFDAGRTAGAGEFGEHAVHRGIEPAWGDGVGVRGRAHERDVRGGEWRGRVPRGGGRCGGEDAGVATVQGDCGREGGGRREESASYAAGDGRSGGVDDEFETASGREGEGA